MGVVVWENLVGFRDEVKWEGGVGDAFCSIIKFCFKEAAELCKVSEDKGCDAQVIGDDGENVLEDVTKHLPQGGSKNTLAIAQQCADKGVRGSSSDQQRV
jgi:hypothetical protein